MTKIVDTFFVVDFDRCIGNVVVCYDLLKNLSHELYGIDEQKIQAAYDISLEKGVSFSALNYIKDQNSIVDLSQIEKKYLERAAASPNGLLEVGAFDFLNYLQSTDLPFCIMSFGNKRWQMLKINASGIGDKPVVIVKKSQKSHYINKWLDEKSGYFLVPKECTPDGISIKAREVVLVDDKATAFRDLPLIARGYLVSGSAYDQTVISANSIPSSVKQVKRVDEIIALESVR